MTENDIARLIEGCRKGDRKSQEALYRTYYGKMLTVCKRYFRDLDQARDVAQEGCFKVFTNLEKYNGKGAFEGWMRRIMVNMCIDRHRKSQNDFVLLSEDYSMDTFGDVVEEEETDDHYDFTPEQVMAAMESLTPAYRTIFNPYIFENLQHKEIAEKLGISVGTSKSNLAKAKRNLKRVLLTEAYKKDHG